MTAIIGRNQNTAATATVDNPVLMSPGSTAETVLVANIKRVYVAISIRGFDVFIRLEPAADDATTRRGVFVEKDSTFFLEGDNIYTGEISIINSQGAQSPVFFVTEF